jgi:hypothetical protein
MPESTSMPAGGPDGALAWYNQSLAKVLGLNATDPTLPADMLSELATDAQRKALGAVIANRFRRNVDLVTGAVTIDQVGDALLLAEPAEESDPVVAGLATSYLGAASAAISAVDPSRCIPGICADQVADIVRHIQSTIDTVTAEAPARRNGFQMYLHLNELTNDAYGLLPKLTKIFAGRNSAAIDTVAGEQALASIRIAKRALSCFEEAIREIRAGDEEPSLAEVSEIVRGCGGHVATHAANVRNALRGAGIGECELRAVELPIGAIVQLSGESFETVSLDQALHTLETETKRWPGVIASGRRDGFALVSASAETLRPMVAAIDPEAILIGLGILADSDRQSEPREAFALGLSYQLDRLRGYALSVLDMILRDGRAPGRPVPKARRRQQRPPADEAAPLT